MAEIQLRNVSKRWGSFVGVHDFNLTIPDQEFLVLLGPSGCGKTTTMRMIAGLEDASGGDIFVDGKRINDLETFCTENRLNYRAVNDSALPWRVRSCANQTFFSWMNHSQTSTRS